MTTSTNELHIWLGSCAFLWARRTWRGTVGKDVLYHINGIRNSDCSVAVDISGSQWVGGWSSGENVGHQINHVSDVQIVAMVSIAAEVAAAEILPEPRLQ